MKSLKSFFDHRHAHEDIEHLWRPLFLILVATLFPFLLVAPVTSTVVCLLLLLISLTLHYFKVTIYSPVAYAVGIAILMGMRNSMPGGYWSREFLATVWAVLTICKSLRIRKYGDGAVFLILVLAANASILLLDDSVTITVWTTVMAIFAMTQLLRLNIADVSSVTLLASLKSAALMTVYALPLLTFLFFIFHKATSYRIGFASNTAMTGLSDTLEPGQVSRLASNSLAAFRAKIDHPIPPLEATYWRATALTESHGMQWRHGKQTFQDDMSDIYDHSRACLFIQTIYPQQGAYLPFKIGLDRPIPKTTFGVSPYTISSRICHWNEDLSSEERAQDLKISFAPSAHVIELAAQLKKSAASTADLPKVIMKYYRDNGFKYSMEPNRTFSRMTMDEFLFGTKIGFCEHFAAATASLLRLAGVPARVVIGFEGGDYNPIGGYWLVAYSDAHAWVEVWSDQEGWMRVDPAAALVPGGFKQSHNSLKWMNEVLDAFFFEVSSFFNNREKLLSLSDITFDWSLALSCLILLFVSLQINKWRRPLDQVVSEDFGNFCRLLNERGLPRRRSEGFDDYRRRVLQWMGENREAAPLAPHVSHLFSFYVDYRYGSQAKSEEELKTFCHDVRRLQSRLRLKTTPILRWLKTA